MENRIESGSLNHRTVDEEKTANQKKRYAWIDALRGISAFTVVVYHITLTDKDLGEAFMLYGYIDLGRIAVFTFFLISGYVMRVSTGNQSGNNTFLVRRLVRVYPAYFVCMMIAIALCFNGYYGEIKKNIQSKIYEQSPVKYIAGAISMEFSNLTGQISPLGVDWTLAVELIFYIQMYIIVLSRVRISFKWIYLLFLILSMVSDFCRFFPFLYAGTLFWEQSKNQLSTRSLWALLALLPISCVISNYPYYSPETRFNFATCATLSLLVFGVSYHRQYLTENKIVMFLGRISYSMYLVHMIVIYSLMHRQFPYQIITCVSLVVILSCIFYKVIEKPSMEAARHFR